MLDRTVIRNAGTGVFAILSYLVLYPVGFDVLLSALKDLETSKVVLVSVPGIICLLLSLPLFGFFIYQLTVTLWGWGLYRDEARRIIAEQRFKEHDRGDLHNGCSRPIKKVRRMVRESFFWDPVFVIDYYQDCPEHLIDWSRRKRDSQLFSLNMITAIYIALVGGAVTNALYLGAIPPSSSGLILSAVVALFFFHSYFYHKRLADYAELIWAERFLAGKRINMKSAEIGGYREKDKINKEYSKKNPTADAEDTSPES